MSEQETTGRAKYTPGPYEAELQKIIEERQALAAFKDYVHKRLDDAGVPTDPESPHKAEGCRIGGRLDIVLARYAAVPELLEALRTAEATVTWYSNRGEAAVNARKEIREAVTDVLKQIRAALARAEGIAK